MRREEKTHQKLERSKQSCRKVGFTKSQVFQTFYARNRTALLPRVNSISHQIVYHCLNNTVTGLYAALCIQRIIFTFFKCSFQSSCPFLTHTVEERHFHFPNKEMTHLHPLRILHLYTLPTTDLFREFFCSTTKTPKK